MPILFSILVACNPGASFFTMNALIFFVVMFLAKIMSISAKVLFPTQRFWPSRIQPPSTCTAVVLKALASLP
nr:hypothetical protein Iba_scaffold8000.4CG1430 [Ipomoea batatas]